MNDFMMRAAVKLTLSGRALVEGFDARRRRAAGFFEYALIALIAVALMVIVYNGFKTQLNNLFSRISGDVSTNTGRLTP